MLISQRIVVTCLHVLQKVTNKLAFCMFVLESNSGEEPETSIFQLLRVPSILVTCISIVIGTMVWSVLDPTLQPHLTAVFSFFYSFIFDLPVCSF